MKVIGFHGGGWGGSDAGASLSLDLIAGGVGFDVGGASLTGTLSRGRAIAGRISVCSTSISFDDWGSEDSGTGVAGLGIKEAVSTTWAEFSGTSDDTCGGK